MPPIPPGLTTDPHVADIGALWDAVRRSATRAAPWQDLARAYASLDLHWQARYAYRQAARLDPAGTGPAPSFGIDRNQDAGDEQLGRATLRNATPLAATFAARLAVCPNDWLTWLYLARLLELADAPADGMTPEQATDRARALEFMPGETLHWLGVWRLNAGDPKGAITAFSGLLNLDPQRHGSMMYLGDALLRVGNIAAAEKAFQRASRSNNPDFLMTLAARVYAHNYWREAIGVLDRTADLRPDNVPILLALAKIQSEVYDLAACRDTLRRIDVLSPGNAEARLLEAGLCGRMGDARGHLESLTTAYETGGDPRSRLASSIAMTSLYNDAMTPEEVAALHRRLCLPIEENLPPSAAFTAARPDNARLRVGFVTGDLHRQHPVNIFMLPILARLDRTRINLHIYHTGTMHDAFTLRAQGYADRWMEAAALTDADLNAAIVADGIDVLIDLAGHTATHRLGVFAMRSAPVQATFLGYPHSTGLAAMDCLIGDAVVSPANHSALFTESLAQMPASVFCWAPAESWPLSPARPPDAPVTFGSFNNAMKLSPRTVALWASVLRGVPGSMLLLKAPSLRDQAVQARFIELFHGHEIGPERLVFRGPSGLDDMMGEYGDIDIALDPTPYNGGTTTLQALWMGVPVITLAGGNFVSRMGASFLRTLGRTEWVAASDEDYISIAADLAGDIMTLRQARADNRARMAASGLCGIDGYVAAFGALLHRMWAAHRAGGGERVIQLPGGA